MAQGELSKHAISEGTKAVTKFSAIESAQKAKKKREKELEKGL